MKNKFILIIAVIAACCINLSWQSDPKHSSSLQTNTGQLAPIKAGIKILRSTSPIATLYILSAFTMNKPLHTLPTAEDIAITRIVGGERSLFSRTPMRDYEYVATVSVTPDYCAVIYRSAPAFSDQLYGSSYYLATINNAGEVISSREIAALLSPLNIMTAAVNLDGSTHSEEIDQKWEKDPLIAGYTNNKVIKQEVKEATNYKVKTTGYITAEKVEKKKEPMLPYIEADKIEIRQVP